MARTTRTPPKDRAAARGTEGAVAAPVEDSGPVVESPEAAPDAAPTGPDAPAEVAADPSAPPPAPDESGSADAGVGHVAERGSVEADVTDPIRTRKTIGLGTDAPGPDPRMGREPKRDALTVDGDAERQTAVPRVTPRAPEPDVAPVPAASGERSGGGFLPLLLGGLLAGAIGYAIATWVAPGAAPDADLARIEGVETRIGAIEARSGADPAAAELGALRDAQGGLADEVAALSERIGALEARTDDVADAAEAVAPSDLDALDGRLGDATARLDALAGELEALRGSVDGTAGEIEALSGEVSGLVTRLDGIVVDLGGRVSAVEAGLDEATARASSVEDEAAALAREAARNQVRIALESGAPYVEPLSVLGEAPADLAATAESGVAALGALIADFPPLAREALRAARAEAAGGGVGGLLQSAFGARSLEPREGDDADAVLSRAEAALRSGDLAGALSEIDALPASAQAAFADWTERARTRLAARTAADDFLQDG